MKKQLTVSVWWGIKDYSCLHSDSGHHRAFWSDKGFDRTLCKKKIRTEVMAYYPIPLADVKLAFLGREACKECTRIERRLIKQKKIFLPPRDWIA